MSKRRRHTPGRCAGGSRAFVDASGRVRCPMQKIEPAQAEEMLASGNADMVGLAHGILYNRAGRGTQQRNRAGAGKGRGSISMCRRTR